MFQFLGGILLVVLVVMGIRRIIQRRQLLMGQLQECPHCGRPYKDTPVYCPNCNEVLRTGGSSRR